jgi:hypothetical protein
MPRSSWIRILVTLTCGLVLGAAAYAMSLGVRVVRCEVHQESIKEQIDRIDHRVEDLWKLFYEGQTPPRRRR